MGPKLKNLNDKATVQIQKGKAHASTKCTELSDKVVAAICTPKVKEVLESFKESKVGKTLQQTGKTLQEAYVDHGAPKIKSFKEFSGKMAAKVCADLAHTMKSFEAPEEVASKED